MCYQWFISEDFGFIDVKISYSASKTLNFQIVEIWFSFSFELAFVICSLQGLVGVLHLNRHPIFLHLLGWDED